MKKNPAVRNTTMRIRNSCLISLVLLLLAPSLAYSDLTIADSSQQREAALPLNSRIAIASGVRVRSAPSVTAREIARLQLGAVVKELERTSTAEKIGGVEDYWYRVAMLNGQQGWVFGSFVAPFDPSRKADTYRRIAAERRKVESSGFTDLADLVRFLSVAITEVTERDALADLELARLLAMKRAAASIPIDQQEEPRYQAWIKAQASGLVFSDPAGQWFVKSALFWELQKKYGSLPIADQIAWEGARNFLPGECEGSLPCHFSLLNQTDGRYLDLYPRGAHAEAALNNIAGVLEELYDLTKGSERPTAEDSAEALKELVALRAIVAKTASTRKTRVSEQISLYLRYYR